jgi:hypothetical protein
MKSARWNWLVLVVGGCVSVGLGVVGIVAGARLTDGPMNYLLFGVGLVVGSVFVRRACKRYETEVLPLAADDLAAESESR